MDIPKAIVIDCDGVLTDGTISIDHRGKKMFKTFHTRDVRAIRELIFHGFEVYIISADDWEGGLHFAEKVGAVFIHSKFKDQATKKVRPYIAVGDDAWDVPMMEHATIRYCPADADPSIANMPNMRISPHKGGRGVMVTVLLDIVKNLQPTIIK